MCLRELHLIPQRLHHLGGPQCPYHRQNRPPLGKISENFLFINKNLLFSPVPSPTSKCIFHFIYLELHNNPFGLLE